MCVGQFSSSACKAAFENLVGVSEASCTRSATVDGMTNYTVTFLDFPEMPYQVRTDRHLPTSRESGWTLNSGTVLCVCRTTYLCTTATRRSSTSCVT